VPFGLATKISYVIIIANEKLRDPKQRKLFDESGNPKLLGLKSGVESINIRPLHRA
jgi:hypothetical protein